MPAGPGKHHVPVPATTFGAVMLARLSLLILAAFLFAAAPAAAEEALNPAQKQAVETVVRDYLRAHPEMILEALQELQARKEAEDQNRARQTLVDRRGELHEDPAAPVLGNPKGDVTLVEFFDYRCGYCKGVAATVADVVRQDGNVRLVFKDFPILGPASVVASRAALAAWRLDRVKYLPFHKAMMESTGNLTESKVMQLAVSQGLNADQLAQAMKAPEIEVALQRNLELAKVLDINGTPAFIIGDHVVPGAIGADSLKSLIAEARRKKS